MKYSIFINQKAFVTHFQGGDIDLIDLAIFDYCRDIITSPNTRLERIIHEEKIYTWINYTHLINSMPILGVTSNDVIRRRLNSLIKAGILCKYVFRAKAYFKLGTKADLLYFDSDTAETPAEKTPENTPQTPPDAEDTPSEGPDKAEPTPPKNDTNNSGSEETKTDIPDEIDPNQKVGADFSEGVPQPKSGAEADFPDGVTPTEESGYYITKIIQSDQNIRIKGDKDAVPAKTEADGLPPIVQSITALEIAFYRLWERTHCAAVRFFHKERIRLVLEKYRPSESIIEAAIKKNKREDWACEDIVRECNKDHVAARETTADEMRTYVNERRKLQRQAGYA